MQFRQSIFCISDVQVVAVVQQDMFNRAPHTRCHVRQASLGPYRQPTAKETRACQTGSGPGEGIK